MSAAFLSIVGPAQVRVWIVGGTLYFDTTSPPADLHFGCLVIYRYGGDGSVSTYCRGSIGPGFLQEFKFWSKGLFLGSPATATFTILTGPPFGAVKGRWSGALVGVPP